MAHTLTFSGCAITINGTEITSGYALKNGDVLSLEDLDNVGQGIKPNGTLTINGTVYDMSKRELTFSDTDLNIVYEPKSGFVPFIAMLISYTETVTPRKSVDLTTLSGWAGLSSGAHSIQLKAKAAGYTDSELSQAVSVTKAPSGETWVLYNSLSTAPLLTTFNTKFSSNGKEYTELSIWDLGTPSVHDYHLVYDTDFVYDYNGTGSGAGRWENEAYRTITFETAPTGDLLAWLQANGVKQ